MPAPSPSSGAERVVVIVNERAPESVVLARRYFRARGVPARNVVRVSCSPAEIIADDACDDLIVRPVRSQLAKTGLDKTADFLMTTRGVPLVTASGFSVDGRLMVMDAPTSRTFTPNPYFGKSRAFSRRAFGGLYLCTRLDGYTAQDARALVTHSLAARPQRGPFLLDADPRRQRPGYSGTNDQMRAAAAWLRANRFAVRLDDTPEFARAAQPLAGYFSWGSNDGAFDPAAYAALRFLPGAIAETAVSTSARTLRAGTTGGQSLIADLIAQGVTGVKGYVSEPFLFAIAHPDILFARYLSGRNLAEAFYAASTVVNWKDVVLGDPLCAPYVAA